MVMSKIRSCCNAVVWAVIAMILTCCVVAVCGCEDSSMYHDFDKQTACAYR